MNTLPIIAGLGRAPWSVFWCAVLATGTPIATTSVAGETRARRPEAAATSPEAQAWKWSDLVNRPERWPPSVKLLRDVTFQGGGRFAAGTTLRVAKVTPRNVEVLLPDGGRTDFAPADTDIIAAANTHWAGLSPEQRRIDYAVIARDATLQPPAVTTFVNLHFSREKIAAGTEVPLVEFANQRVNVWSRVERKLMAIAPHETDLLSRARALAAQAPGERPDRFPPLFAGTAVDQDGRRAEVPPARYFVFYRGSATCPNTVSYTPRFVERISRILERHDQVRLVSLSNDASAGAMMEFARQHRIPGYFVAASDLHPAFFRYQAQVMPALVVVDRLGREIASQRRYTGPASLDLVLDRLETELTRAAVTP